MAGRTAALSTNRRWSGRPNLYSILFHSRIDSPQSTTSICLRRASSLILGAPGDQGVSYVRVRPSWTHQQESSRGSGDPRIHETYIYFQRSNEECTAVGSGLAQAQSRAQVSVADIDFLIWRLRSLL